MMINAAIMVVIIEVALRFHFHERRVLKYECYDSLSSDFLVEPSTVFSVVDMADSSVGGDAGIMF